MTMAQPMGPDLSDKDLPQAHSGPRRIGGPEQARPGVRMRSHWFASERPRTPIETAAAMAFILWRVANHVLRNMRRADFEIDAGPRYFDFLTEWLVFLVHVADRRAFVRIPGDRIAFTTALANRVGEILADNRMDLLADEDAGVHKQRFLDLLNLRLEDYADYDAPDVACRRYLAMRLAETVGERDQVWLFDQVMEIEAPDAIALVERGLSGLLDPASPRRRGGEAGAE
jgi:hypothetical protein